MPEGGAEVGQEDRGGDVQPVVPLDVGTEFVGGEQEQQSPGDTGTRRRHQQERAPGTGGGPSEEILVFPGRRTATLLLGAQGFAQRPVEHRFRRLQIEQIAEPQGDAAATLPEKGIEDAVAVGAAREETELSQQRKAAGRFEDDLGPAPPVPGKGRTDRPLGGEFGSRPFGVGDEGAEFGERPGAQPLGESGIGRQPRHAGFRLDRR